MKIYGAFLTLLAIVGVALWVYSETGPALEEGQAGVALVKNEKGELVQASERRGAHRTTIPLADRDGESLSGFELLERSGETVSSDDLKGQPYVAGFFFSTCPSICVRQNSKTQTLQQQFAGQPVRFVSISCDPEVDQPDVLSEYAERFDADKEQWLFFTGNMKYISQVGNDVFRLGVERRGHPEKFALMDANGVPYGWYTWTDENQWKALQEDIAKLLAAGGVIEDGNETE